MENSNSAVPAVRTSAELTFDTGTAAVTNANLAYSQSSDCTGCRTVAVAVQAVVIEGVPTAITPQNAAVALNNNCQSCMTFAYAQQYVFSPEHPVTLGRGTTAVLAGLQAAMRAVAASDESFTTMNSNLNDLSWAYCETVQVAIQTSGPNPGPPVCGAPPFDNLQVQTRD
ncbi:MAG: hypothetical protein ACRDZ8_05270 [Acidimicrobiales bacterium]